VIYDKYGCDPTHIRQTIRINPLSHLMFVDAVGCIQSNLCARYFTVNSQL